MFIVFNASLGNAFGMWYGCLPYARRYPALDFSREQSNVNLAQRLLAARRAVAET